MIAKIFSKKRIGMTLVICLLSFALTAIVHLTNIKDLYNANSTDALPIDLQPSPCSYVGFENLMPDDRLGNYLFFYSTVMYVGSLTGRRPCISTTDDTPLDSVFDVDIPRVDFNTSGCPLYKFFQCGNGVYDKRVESLVHVSKNKLLLLSGYFQSWKYAEPIANQLRQQLRFRQEHVQFADNFLATNVPAGWTTLEFVRVGVHVRRGDFLTPRLQYTGYAIASEQYLQRAMSYFVERFPRVQFIVASDDIPWCQKHVKLSIFNKTDVNITFSVNHNSGQDLALLANCDHTVMTTGTFSWWAAWLTNGITVYCADYPKRGSWLSTQIHNTEYYHPGWIGLDNCA